jgi:hypothetical protein
VDDSKRGLNLAGTTVVNIKNEVVSLAGAIENQLLPKVRSLASEFQKIEQSAKGISGFGGGTSGGPNKIATSGAEGTGGGAGGGGTNRVADSGAAGGGNLLGRTSVALGGAYATMNLAASAMPSAATAVRQDLLNTQAAFYGFGGQAGSLAARSANVRQLQYAMAQRGIFTSPQDAANAMAAAQAAGLSGATNLNQVMQSAAITSAFTPGLGAQGAIGVEAGIQTPTTVNMLRTLGINVRGPNGEMMSVPQLVDKIWNLLTNNGKTSLSQKELQIGLMPGNGAYSLLQQLFNGDPSVIIPIQNMLLAKAAMGGKPAADISKGDLKNLGLTTATVNAMSQQTAAQTNLLNTTASATAAGYGLSADLGTALNNFAAAAGPLTQAIGALTGGYTGVMGLGNGAVGSVVKGGLGVAAGNALTSIGKKVLPKLLDLLPLLALEKGGPAEAKSPYIVGEKGPELFVPTTDGVVVPNSALKNSPFRQAGGSVSAGGMSISNPTDWATALLTGLGARPTQQAVNDLLFWYGKEGGNWHNTATFNPLNTSYTLPGSVNYNTGKAGSGVQAYSSWAQGLQATIGTLTGKDAASRGYSPIVSALTSGGVSTDAFFKLMQASSWDAGHYKGGASSSYPAASANSALSDVSVTTDYTSKIQDLIARSSGAAGLSSAGTSNTYNHGPLTINISGGGDVKKITDALKKILSDNNLIAQLGAK